MTYFSIINNEIAHYNVLKKLKIKSEDVVLKRTRGRVKPSFLKNN